MQNEPRSSHPKLQTERMVNYHAQGQKEEEVTGCSVPARQLSAGGAIDGGAR
ncbi:MAG: hypothetical protein RL595_1159 [Planctomycetota bacterium]|jgi:hypothetical protein